MDDKLKEFVDKHKGELVIDGVDVVLLEGMSEDEEDIYYIVAGKSGRYWVSGVVALYPLKDVLPANQYDDLIYLFKNNLERWILESESKNKLVEWETKWNQVR